MIAKAVMKVKDERINKTNEVVNAIKLVKCNGWEDIFRDGVMRARKAELAQLTQYILFRTLIMVFFTAVRALTPTRGCFEHRALKPSAGSCAHRGLRVVLPSNLSPHPSPSPLIQVPLMVSAGTFTCYVMLGNTLTAATAFTAISLFNILRFPLAMLPNVINNLVEANVSLKRIQDFLESEDLDPSAVLRSETPAAPGEAAVGFTGDATFSWLVAPVTPPNNAPLPALARPPAQVRVCRLLVSGAALRQLVLPHGWDSLAGRVGTPASRPLCWCRAQRSAHTSSRKA